MPSYVDSLTQTSPPWLQGFWAKKWWRVIGTPLDTLATYMRDAVKCHSVTVAPTDSLGYHGVNRGGIERVPGDTDAVYRERLRTCWDLWRSAGTRGVHQTTLGWLGWSAVTVWRHAEWGISTQVYGAVADAYSGADGGGGRWSAFWLLVRQPHSFESATTWTWGGGWSWGDVNFCWGWNNMDPQEVARMRRLVRQFRSGHSSPIEAVFQMGTGGWVWAPDAGPWGDAAFIWGNGVAESLRLPILEPQW